MFHSTLTMFYYLSFIKKLFSTYYVLGTVLGTKFTAVEKSHNNPWHLHSTKEGRNKEISEIYNMLKVSAKKEK